jgi:hypothetical protein
MTMPNRTYELRKAYSEYSNSFTENRNTYNPLLLQWPSNGYFEKFTLDAELLRNALFPRDEYQIHSVAERIFGSQKQLEYLSLKHLRNLFYERCQLHKEHIQDINHRHLDIQEKKFGAELNRDAKRLSNLEGQLLQLEKEQRDEKLAFWKDTTELREKMFEKASSYRAARQRYSVFSSVEGQYGG